MPDAPSLLSLLNAVAEGRLTPGDALSRFEAPAPLSAATIDFDREARCGFPEVVLAAGKTPDDAAAIASAIFRRHGKVLATRATPAHAEKIAAVVPGARYHAVARVVRADENPKPREGRVVVVSAGTADLPVAEEAAHTAEAMGAEVDRVVDVGVAGLHRVLAQVERIRAAHAVVVCAGMDGALPSVVGGLVATPVIAVPVSTGYGVAFGGVAALLAILNSCAAGVSAVNVDNGFGAGYQAALVARLAAASGRRT